MALREILLPWTEQPQEDVGIDWGNPLTAGLKIAQNFVQKAAFESASNSPVTYGSNKADGLIAVTQNGRGYIDGGGSNVSVSYPSWANTTGEASALVVQCRTTTVSNVWWELGTSANQDHFPSSGLIYSDAFWSSRWINAASVLSGKSITVPHVIVVTVKSGAQRAYWDGALWVSASGTGGFTLPATLALHNAAGFRGYTNLFACWDRVLSADEAASLSANPWQLFAPRRVLVQYDAMTGTYTLSAATYTPGSITSSGLRARVTVTAA